MEDFDQELLQIVHGQKSACSLIDDAGCREHRDWGASHPSANTESVLPGDQPRDFLLSC